MTDLEIIKGDDSDAFGGRLLEIDVEDADKFVISKAVVSCGKFIREYNNPQFPIIIHLSGEDTRLLDYRNYWHVALYDGQGKKHTFKKCLLMKANNEVIPDSDKPVISTNTNSTGRASTTERILFENDVGLTESKITFKFNVYPSKLSQLNDDIGIIEDLTALQEQVNNFQLAENTEITDIIALIEQKTDNLIDFTEL